MRERGNAGLHVSAVGCDDGVAVSLCAGSLNALALHGFAPGPAGLSGDAQVVLVGGGSTILKGYLLEARAERGSDEYIAGVLSGGLYLGRTFTYYADLEGKIANLTTAEVNRAMRANWTPERLVIIRAGDFKMEGAKK